MSGGRYSFFRNESVERLAALKFSKHRQYQAGLIASLAATAAGTSDGWMMMSLDDQRDRRSKPLHLYHFISYTFAIVGAIVFGCLSDTIGRKSALILVGAIMLPVWVLYWFGDEWSVAAGLVLSGLAAGGATVAVPLYISDVADRSTSNILIVLFYQLFIAGELVTFFGNSHDRLASTASFAFLIALIFLLTFMWMPESPYYLLTVGQEMGARKSLEFFRSDRESVENEVTTLKESATKRSSITAMIRNKDLRRILLVSIGLTFFSRLVAVDSFNYRLLKQYIYKETPNGSTVKLGFGIHFVVQIVSIGLGAFFIERCGRRPLLFVSSFGVLSSAILMMFVPLFENFSIFWLPVFFLYIGAFAIGLGPTPWVLAGELFPPEHKTMSYTLNAVVFWGMASFAPERLLLAVKYFGNFFGVFNVILVIAVILYIESVIPETKNSNLNAIQTEISRLISRFGKTQPPVIV